MKIKFKLDDLVDALSFASTVKPSNKENASAYLFTVSDGRCYIHSQDAQYIRTEVPVLEVDGTEEGGSFTYPADRVDALKYKKGWIEIESGKDASSERYWIRYKTENGSKSDFATFNPRLFNTMEKALSEAATEYTCPTILLREGLTLTSKYMAKEATDSNSPLMTVQIFDKSEPDWEQGDGTMFAADGYRACFFYSPALEGKGLAVQAKHVPHLNAFLGKCEDTVKIKVGAVMTFIIDQVPGEDGTVRDGTVFGWTHHSKKHPKYKYYPSSYDKFRLLVPKQMVLDALLALRAERKDRSKVRVTYQDQSLSFVISVNKEISQSPLVGVDPLNIDGDVPSGPEFAVNYDVNYLIDLFESSRDHNVELRMAPINKKFGFRTISKFWMGNSGKTYTNPADAKETCYECLVTHFATSME